MTNELKVFTLEEAEHLIPILTDFLAELRKKRNEINDLEVEIDALELISGSQSRASVKDLNLLIATHQKVVGEFYVLVDQIHAQRCFLKDVDMGLIDFYGVMDGRVVYFCWKLGEERIDFWHEVGQGYGTRQPLSRQI